jgi:hypothetical protein
MTHASSGRSASSLEVPAFETDDTLLALLPKDAVNRKAGASATAIKDIDIVVVGENHDFSLLAGEIKSAWAQLNKPGSRLTNERIDRPAPLVTYLLASAFAARSRATPADPAWAALISRLARAISRATTIAGDDLIRKALEQPTDIGTIVELLRSTLPMLSAEQEIDPKLGGALASLEGEEDLVRRAGGLKDADWVAKYLSINRKSVAAKARRNELLTVTRGDRNLYPAFQFKDGTVVPGIRDILAVLPLRNGWSRLSFLLTPDPGLDDRSPIEAFATDPEAILALAACADNQGAA